MHIVLNYSSLHLIDFCIEKYSCRWNILLDLRRKFHGTSQNLWFPCTKSILFMLLKINSLHSYTGKYKNTGASPTIFLFLNHCLMCLKVFFSSFSCQLKWCKSPFFVLGTVSYLWISNYQKHLSVCNLLKRILHWASSTFLGMCCLHIGILKKLQM